MAKRRNSAKKKEAIQLDGGSDLGTPEARRHGMAELFYSTDPNTKQTVRRARVTVQVKLDYLRAIKTISHGEFEAGDRFRGDYHLAGLMPRVTVNLAATGGGGAHDISDRSVDALARVRSALSALSADDCQVAIWLLVWDCDARYIGNMLGGVCKRSQIQIGVEAIHSALMSLADFYGIDCHD